MRSNSCDRNFNFSLSPPLVKKILIRAEKYEQIFNHLVDEQIF